MSPSADSVKSSGRTTKLWVPVLVTVTVTLACTTPEIIVGVMVGALTSSRRSPNWTDTSAPAAEEGTCAAGRPAGWPAGIAQASTNTTTASRNGVHLGKRIISLPVRLYLDMVD